LDPEQLLAFEEQTSKHKLLVNERKQNIIKAISKFTADVRSCVMGFPELFRKLEEAEYNPIGGAKRVKSSSSGTPIYKQKRKETRTAEQVKSIEEARKRKTERGGREAKQQAQVDTLAESMQAAAATQARGVERGFGATADAMVVSSNNAAQQAEHAQHLQMQVTMLQLMQPGPVRDAQIVMFMQQLTAARLALEQRRQPPPQP